MAEKKTKTEDKVTVFIPKTNRDDTQRFVEVNGRTAIIATGKSVEVPKIFAEVINDSLAQKDKADEFIEANKND